ncbi:MAG: helix-turn-helix domain-containing protein [Magnetococcus sp. YQC-5]
MTTHESTNIDFSQRFKTARRHAGLTQQALAKLVGISQAAIHKLEAGHFQSSRKTVLIALVCQVNPVWLETGVGDMITIPSQKPEETMPLPPEPIKITDQLNAMARHVDQTLLDLTAIKNQIRLLQNCPEILSSRKKRHNRRASVTPQACSFPLENAAPRVTTASACSQPLECHEPGVARHNRGDDCATPP